MAGPRRRCSPATPPATSSTRCQAARSKRADIAAALGVAGVRMTGLHYAPRADRNGMVIAEADTATGHVDTETLEALADVASWMPIKN